MKTLIYLIAFICLSKGIYAQDVPGFIPNIQNAPVGTVVLPMDTVNQADANATPRFNLKVYGLAVQLLNKGYNLKWVIRTGKAKDGIDFSATAERIWPTYIAPAARDFRGSALILFPADTNGVSIFISAFNNALAAVSRVQVFRLTTAVNVDIRYNMVRTPRIAVLSDGNNQGIHTNFLAAASVPTSNYVVINATSLTTDCFTFASEPHLMGVSTGGYLSAVRTFVTNGGNFLAQCEAIETYENLSFGFYQSSTGMVTTNAAFSGTVNYTNNDMSFAQFDGPFNPSGMGSVKNWTFNGAGSPQNNFYSVIGNTLNPAHIGASVSKVTGGSGGLVFYLGNHNFNVAGTTPILNGIRMYLNAMLTPSSLACNGAVWLLPVKIQSLEVTGQTNDYNELTWTTSEEEANSWYIPEASTDGIHFTSLGRIDAVNEGGIQKYTFRDRTFINAKTFYRLRIENVHGKIVYSKTIAAFRNSGKGLNLFPNPASDHVNIVIPFEAKGASLQILDCTGKVVKKYTITGRNISLPFEHFQNGIYYVILNTDKGIQLKEKLIINNHSER